LNQLRATAKSIDGWLKHLDIARTKEDEASLRGALDFARTELPFWPKEAWQVAKSLSEITGSTADREMFQHLDLMRTGGAEGLGPEPRSVCWQPKVWGYLMRRIVLLGGMLLVAAGVTHQSANPQWQLRAFELDRHVGELPV
jgi:hypothetical protein